ncbi:metal-dependent hydrolase family protein [Sphingopyxis macrogoltabida]|uniref:Hydrolase n=2 Tax=Sphingopyxis macrogoltabida TaxID=33050 RepID=A0AAC9AUF1_SPHMC|nr:amidohydrolase family protein [Sphingopyxis macrogoltabida]AMU88036.1 hydrolase [Sphingopyxis macrogoltabida]
MNMTALRWGLGVAAAVLVSSFSVGVQAQDPAASETLFRNVRVLDVVKGQLGAPTNVLIEGGRIAKIGGDITPRGPAKIVEGGGRTLMPGMIDVHVHLTFGALTMPQMLSPDLTPEKAEDAAGRQAHDMLLRGFTAVRDAGGPIFGLKRRIDAGDVVGPRVWPSGAVISQTSGHGDFRLPSERSRKFGGTVSRSELFGANFIADGTSEVLTATRENLRFGASQIKLMAGGGTSSDYDPIDVTQYTFEEMKAAADAAADWNTYVMVHAYTPRAVRRAIDAGVKCIEHGQLLDEATLRVMAEKGIWLSTQTLADDNPNMDPNRREKRREILANNAALWQNAKKLGVKLAWGTDFLFEPELNAEQNAYLIRLKSWFTPAEIVKLVTYDNAQLLALSGPRTPYAGKLGVVEEGALADLILVDGDPLARIDLLGDPAKNFDVIMKDGKFYKGGQ